MEGRHRGTQRPPISRPIPEATGPNPPSVLRPLSDIRELTEPSLIDLVANRSSAQASRTQHARNASKAGSMRRAPSVKRNGSVRIVEPEADGEAHARARSAEDIGPSSSYSTTPEEPSGYYTIPSSSVPRRSSSRNRARQPTGLERMRYPSRARLYIDGPTIPPQPPVPLPPTPTRFGLTVPNHGASESPVKAAEMRSDPVASDLWRGVPSKTYVRSPAPTDIADCPVFRHPRLKLELQTSAPLFVGGGSVEGRVRIVVDDNERMKNRRSLKIGAASMDLLGLEEATGHRRSTFLALGTELLDSKHPPPSTMIEPGNPLSPTAKFWTLKPSISALPFMISLPLDTGPPPFQCKTASIRYLLSATVTIQDAGKLYRVRTCQDVCVLPTYDPEQALTSSPAPMTTSDELSIQK